ncbi:UvrB/UvrC protein [Gottschalkia purinilytica]|uniref:UvrB/UvrC protein n=1 Tax=Gottschalkia purinilytica TaxID=1503 RepID=A0A0L0W8W7_GOTPU|nr:UvrB/UvrC motif-containing protein [Gottschalkia purinilytica]KNF07983.1 UvrB/UvrC protein [Gottschalkia purinilytica]
MMCEECGKNPSTVHMKNIINGKVTEVHICEECAKKHKGFATDTPFSIHSLLTGLLDSVQDEGVKVDYVQGTTCDTCGMPYGKFRQLGKFGCSDCYRSFKEKLNPLLKRIHGHDKHVGKIPKKAGKLIRIKKDIEDLKNKLDILVQNEEFEEAAEIRDEIKRLQKELDNSKE